ncbi:MAG: hypothetical protein E7665_03840 [Ruminococcaceae bacterium]|nr:hypothetical protein [Oscillospiraceae bacterium]
MNPKIKDRDTDIMFEAMLTLENTEEFYRLFDDLCTVAEMKEMSKRFKAAIMLDKNIPYNEICAKTGLSTATISRVNRCLKYGSDGYRNVIDRLKTNGALKEEE